ncbi:MAG: CRISPR-associated helicase Cas3' [Thermofilaceae archaeon]|uniref:CRISPR-associated helicase Cas3 n=1 Tax=Thermofilum pendens TaxID=2269 RepID=A0A7C4D1P3_THEPE
MLLEAYDRVLAYVRSSKGAAARRPLQVKALERIEGSGRDSFLVCAPTGYGKSLITMSIALHEFLQDSKVIAAYPLRALIEEQVSDMKKLFSFHGICSEFVGARHMGSRESPYLVHPVTLTTIDTLSLTALGLSPEDTGRVFRKVSGSLFGSLGHYLFSWSSVFSSSFIIMDEIHLMYDSSKSLSFLRALMDMCEDTGVRTILMTATLPRKFEGVLPRGKVERLGFSRDDDPEFYGERSSKKYRVELLYLKSGEKLSRIREVLAKSDFRRALVVFNTVEDAVSFYKLLEGRKVLLHSRFTEEDKRDKLRRLKELQDLGEKHVVVGTQAIEAGVNISSDLIVTEVAPPISLVQRFGRFLRYAEKSGRAFVWVEEDSLDSESEVYKVYNKELVKRTLDYLNSNSDVNLHISYDDFMDKVYLEEPRVDYDIIRKMRVILTDLTRPSTSALKLFIRLEGSFVREGSLFTVVSENGYEVNVSFEYLYRQKRMGLCDDCPEDVYEALIDSLAGRRFHVHVGYDREVGLT